MNSNQFWRFLKIIFCLILFVFFHSCRAQSYRLEFDPVFSPPATIPKNSKDFIYSAPLNQITNQPIIVRIRDQTNSIITPKTNPDVIISSMDVTALKGINSDDWKLTGGRLCQRTLLNLPWPNRLNREKHKKVCGSAQDGTVLVRKFVKDILILDWLSHEHKTGKVPPRSRFLRVSIPELQLSSDSNLFNITVPASTLFISQQPPPSITANTPFDIAAEVHDANNKVITYGLDSVVFVELTVPYEYKQFYHTHGKSMLIAHTEVRLGGPTAIYQGTNDIVIRRRAVNGKVSFKGVRILDISSKFKLNLTMIMSKDPWLRTPDCSTCYADILEKDVDDYGIVHFRPMKKSLLSKTPAVVLTSEFEVTQQKLHQLSITSPYPKTKKLKITRNFPIPGPLILEAQDRSGNRIYSGPDANLPLEFETYPRGVCISVDHTTYIRDGSGPIMGSICQIVKSVVLNIYSKVNSAAKVNSSEFEVVGDVHIAHFDHFKYSGSNWNLEPYINSFIKFGAHDINEGIIPGVLKHFQMKIYVDTVETDDDVARTITMYSRLRRESEDKPNEQIRGIIMPSNTITSEAMIRDANNDEITMISLSQKESEFTAYRFFNRLCWDWDQIVLFFLTACKERGWMLITLVRMHEQEIPEAIQDLSSRMNITFSEGVAFDYFDVNNPPEEEIAEVFEILKNENSRIILCLLNVTYQEVLLPYAHKYDITPGMGYQWIFLSDYAFHFAYDALCEPDVPCSKIFEGSIMFTETYNLSHYHSEDWNRVLGYHFAVDRRIYFGTEPNYPETDFGSMMSLGYDAIWLFSEALSRIVSRQLTATGWLITQQMRHVTIDGLSGHVRLDYNGNRKGFMGVIKIVNNEKEMKSQLVRFVRQVEHDIQVEFKFGMTEKYIDPSSNLSITPVPLPTADVYNLRTFVSYSGGINDMNNRLEEDKTEPWPSVRMQRFEKVVPQFSCKDSCGKRTTIENINLYDRGTCVSMDTCKCFLGYYGHSCQKIMCLCLFGHCAKPFQCKCTLGWSGDKCNIPICSFECVNGKCVEPEFCKCTSRAWVNSACSIHIASFLVPMFILLLAAIYLAYIGSIWLKKYLERKAALSDLSWVVRWSDMVKADGATTSKTSCTMGNLYSWNREKWMIKCFNSKTIDVNDFKVRYDMVVLTTISHKNLITYGGACLTYPNVCLLVEPAYKGSLEDILVNESIELGWDFRFSFMKDICCGMNFLHTKSEITSHGRLKSSNCLLDNRWTIRLSGFGAPTIRYGPYSILTDNTDPDVYMEQQISLLWTAPELLESATCLDDIRMGTKEGDIYSFGIVISEIATRNVPFGLERNFLSLVSILDLIVDKDNPALSNEREVWSSIGGDMFCVRPQITSEQLPEGKAVKKKFKKMLDDVWCEEASARISFQKLVSILNSIHPSKGELMDNLIHLLESYSSNLEQVVVERTNDLEVEKVKIDNIISQMLPKQVVESLKNGEKVQPEIFDNVTVFYSDIVGFTTIARKSKPMQVVDLLNNLYGKFDGILAQYDVYKVETIGDAYVVSSGVPDRNGNAHAGAIATASIDIVCTIMTVPIPHLPDDKLLLRIGIHSGSVVAGVVGLKMPRYTLFGETMQITATLEATSKPLRVQVSQYTINILSELGGYFFKRRGEMEVCSRKIVTYWLIGKDGYEKVLPDIEDD